MFVISGVEMFVIQEWNVCDIRSGMFLISGVECL